MQRGEKIMKVVIDVPQDFEKHFNEDRFEDSLERIRIDTRDEVYQDNSVSGNYELELLNMLIEAFKEARIY